MGALFCKQKAESKPPAYDFYRCSYLRYMGFASVIASKMVPQSFAQIPQMAATAYIFSDVFNKTLTSVENDDDPHRVIVTAVDAILWQTMASVIAPLLLYGSLKSATKLALVRNSNATSIHKTKMKTSKSSCAPQPKKQLLKPTQPEESKPIPAYVNIIPGAISLMLMPFIVRPIQDTVDDILDQTYRKWAHSYLQRTELSIEERKACEKARQLKVQKAEKEAAEKRKKEEQEKKIRLREAEKLAAEKAKQKAKEDELARARCLLQEKEAKARAKQKCLEEEKLRKEQAAAQERAMREKLQQEEAELKEKKARLEKELKEKSAMKTDCD